MGNDKRFHIGCQSWQYEDWVTKPGGETIFYPRETRTSDMLALYSKVFDTIEVDSTAYGVPAVSTLEGWMSATSPEFSFSLKVPRAVTHELSLTPPSFPLIDEFVDVARRLGTRLGSILIQLPATFESTKENAKNFLNFISRLPDDVRIALEFRHPGWFVEWTFDALNERGIALALVAGKWVPQEAMFKALSNSRTRFAYVRLMGVRDLPRFDRIQRDRITELAIWTEHLKALKADEVFVYVDNYFEGLAPATANRLKNMVGQEIIDPFVLDPQLSLF